jgi:predicted ribonuclease YlaK
MKFKFYDTCSLIQEAGHLFKSDDYTLVISSIVFEELEKIKTSNRDADVKFAARRVMQDLDEHYGDYKIVLYNDTMGTVMEDKGFTLTNDAKIIACALDFATGLSDNDKLIFVSNDTICRHIANLFFETE